MVKNSPANAGDIRDSGSVSELGRSPGEGHGSSLQYSCLENPMTEDSGRLQSWGHKESDMTEATEHTRLQGRAWMGRRKPRFREDIDIFCER